MASLGDWDIASGIGVTALMVAAARSIETHGPNPLVEDPHAEAFVLAAASQIALPTRPSAELAPVWQTVADFLAVRSHSFDGLFDGACQAVVLAAGLDSRAYRMNWPPGAVCYELDMPKVLQFKEEVLAEAGAQPRCDRRPIEIDLREDWSSALLAAGFDRTVPTLWLAEGLLPYLPDETVARLFESVQRLSAPGSRIAGDHMTGDPVAMFQQIIVPEMDGALTSDVLAADKTLDPVRWLTEHDWIVTAATPKALGTRYGRAMPDSAREALLIEAVLP